ncbi:hypothetical protein JB92DRAFT_2998757 [Gautieria morchelliformis]|nr:hypothetical protein JB92DRAFT_2998757 [Gautieria morchelliformis]
MPPLLLLPSPLLPSLAPDSRLSASASGALPPQLPSHSDSVLVCYAPPPPLPSLAPDTRLSASAPGALPTQPPSPSTNSIPPAPHKPMMQRGGHVTLHSQQEASCMLQAQRLDLRNMDDLGNGWSKRWSKRHGKGLNVYTRMLLQCQCGTSTDARKTKDDQQQMAKGLPINEKPWLRKTPCLVRKMMRLPAIPLHDHVWQVALQQMMGGAR